MFIEEFFVSFSNMIGKVILRFMEILDINLDY